MATSAQDLLVTFSKANRRSNGVLYETLGDVEDAGLLTKEIGSPFHSILGILSHLYICDVVWLRRFRDGGLGETAAVNDPAVRDFEFVHFRHLTFPALEEWGAARPHMDELLDGLVRSLDNAALSESMDYTNAKGKPLRIRRVDACLHVFNHHAHHRGQVSQALDAFGIWNDFSNVTDATTWAPEK